MAYQALLLQSAEKLENMKMDAYHVTDLNAMVIGKL